MTDGTGFTTAALPAHIATHPNQVVAMAALTKITRAAEHMHAVRRHIDTYINADAWIAVEELEPDGKTALYRLKINKVPLAVSAAVGDVYGSLHECLDHLAWAFGPGEKRADANKETAFPLLVKNPKDRRSAHTTFERTTWGMSAEAKKFIDHFQPYHAFSHTRETDPALTDLRRHLGAVLELSNRRKHRKLTPLALGVAKAHMHLPAGNPAASPINFTVPLKDGDIIPANSGDPIDQSKGAPNFHFSSDIRLHEIAYPKNFSLKVGLDQPITDHLHAAIMAVTTVYNAFAEQQDKLVNPNNHWQSPGWP